MAEEVKEQQPKPLIGKFEIPLPEIVSEEEFNARISGTGPKPSSSYMGENMPPDIGADMDIDF